MLEDFVESYNNLTLKAIFLMKFFVQQTVFSHLFKVSVKNLIHCTATIAPNTLVHISIPG